MLEEAEQERAERGAVRDDELDRRDVVAVVDDGGVAAELGEHRVAVRGVDRDAHGDGRLVAEQPRPRLDVVVGAEVGGRVERVGRADLDVAVDAVGAERADRVAVAVEADDVPVPALRRQAPRLDAAACGPGA